MVDGWKDYSSPIIDLGTFHKWVDQAEKCFPELWAHMCNLREVYGGSGKSKRIIRVVGSRQRQVFISILAYKRMQNPKSLPHWALILSIALKSTGVGACALNVTNYFGIVVSSSKRDSFVKDLYEGSQQRQVDLLLKENFVIFVVDNFQRGQRLKQQRGGHSTSFLSGTNQFAQLPRRFCQPQYIGFKPITELSFDLEQPIVSLFGMPAYKTMDSMDHASFFKQHSCFTSASDVDVTGARVRAYAKRGNVCWEILAIARVAGTISDDGAAKHIKKYISGSSLDSFVTLQNDKEVTALVHNCQSFRKQAVLFWNKEGANVTLMNILGLIGIDEASSTECGGIALDLLRRNGVLVYDTMRRLWVLAETWEDKVVVLFGDVKTVDNINLIEDMIKKSPRSIGSHEDQLAIFEKALSRIVLVPGDWHTGLAKLISINKIFFDGFLEVFHKILGWKNVGKDLGNATIKTVVS